jgi:Uma2 family endonuclease
MAVESEPPGPALIIEEELEELRIPAEVHTLEGFRRWIHCPDFPERGRIDFLDGDVEVGMSPEDLFTECTSKGEIAAVLAGLVADPDLGSVFINRARITSPKGAVSAEPDVVVLLWSSVEGGRVRLIPSASGRPRSYVEIEGAPDLVVEVVSDSSRRKDFERLPPLYARAGIPELWQVDARGEELRFIIQSLLAGVYDPQVQDPEGWTASPVLGGAFRLLREPGRFDTWRYRLEHRG